MSDPKHFDHILPFLQPADLHHAIPLTAQEVLRMHAKDEVPIAAGASELQPDRIPRSGEQSLPAAASSSPQPSRVTRSATTASQHTPHAASGWRIHCGVEVTELSTNKQHFFSHFLLSRFGGECTGTEQRICTERGVISLTEGTQTLQAR